MPDEKRSFARAVVLPASLALVGLGIFGLFLSSFLADSATIGLGLAAAWVAFTTGRLLAHHDRPRGLGVLARHLLTGTAGGLAGWALVRGIFVEGPALWVLLGGCAIGIYRAHRALLHDARGKDADARRLLGLFHPKDLQALGVLLAGYALLGLSGFMVLRSLGSLIPAPLLGIVLVAYGLHGVRLLLAFAAEERGRTGTGVVRWLKANALQAAIVALLLVAYALFRRDLAGRIPYFPLVEFGLGVALFGFVLARLRAKLRKDGTLLASASEARDHERIVSEIREPDYDAVGRPVTRFIESGLGKEEYAQALALSLDPGDTRADAVRAQVLAHRQPPRPPPLEMSWAYAAGAVMTLALAIAAFRLGERLFQAEMPYPLLLSLLAVAFGVYAQQDVARAHHRPWPAVAVAAAGTSLLFLDFLLFVAEVGELRAVPPFAWWIVAAIAATMIGIPALSAWRQEKRLRAGAFADARRLAPLLEMQREIQRTRQRAATMATAAFVILLPAPWLAGWLATRGIIPSGFPAFFDDLLAVAIWIVVALGAAALVRFYGLTRAKPALLAREKAERERRLALHRTMMRSIERT